MPVEARKGEIPHDLVTVRDATPTLLELAGVEHPGTRYKDRDIEPMSGLSFASLPVGGARGRSTARSWTSMPSGSFANT